MTYETYLTLNKRGPLPPVSRILFAATVAVLKWEDRRQTRRALKRLDVHLLQDIGLKADHARTEAAKPFWRD